MNRTEYHAGRRAIHAINQRIAERLRYDDMADSRLVVQMTSDAEAIVRLRRERDAIRQRMPWCGADPLGFRILAQNWARRRAHVEYRCRMRKHDAELRARHDARYNPPRSMPAADGTYPVQASA